MNGNSSKISVDALSCWYGSHQALKDVSMEIYEHAITGLIGPWAVARPPSCAPSTGSTTWWLLSGSAARC